MRLTDDLVLVPRGHHDREGSSRRITLSMPTSDPKARFALPKAARDTANWESVTHVQVRASNRAFVITPCKPGADNAIALNKSNRISISKLSEALGLRPGEVFRIEVEFEGMNGKPKTVVGEWPADLRERIAGVTQMRRSA